MLVDEHQIVWKMKGRNLSIWKKIKLTILQLKFFNFLSHRYPKYSSLSRYITQNHQSMQWF